MLSLQLYVDVVSAQPHILNDPNFDACGRERICAACRSGSKTCEGTLLDRSARINKQTREICQDAYRVRSAPTILQLAGKHPVVRELEPPSTASSALVVGRESSVVILVPSCGRKSTPPKPPPDLLHENRWRFLLLSAPMLHAPLWSHMMSLRLAKTVPFLKARRAPFLAPVQLLKRRRELCEVCCGHLGEPTVAFRKLSQ